MKDNSRTIKHWIFLFSLLIAIALLTPSAEATSYIIITTNEIEGNSTKLADFVTHKSNLGFSVEVITEAEYTSGVTCDERANNIRAWLVINYPSDKKNIEYVLLIGNPHPTTFDSNTSIPMKMCWPRNAQTSYKESPTDFFFADLTGNWNIDGDDYYGEFGSASAPQGWQDFAAGGVDRAPEVYVGRIPYYGTIADLDSILQKIIDYPKANGNWYKSALLPMSFSDVSTDGAYLGEDIINYILTPNSHSKYTLYQQGNGPCGNDSVYPSDQELRGGTVVRDHWAAHDYGFVAWWAHGGQTSAGVGYTDCDDGTLLQSNDCSFLDDDHPAFVLQISCTNGYPENSSNLGYSLLKQGAIATISASRVSWYAIGSWDITIGPGYGDNASYAYYMMKKMIAEGNTVGEANFWCRENFDLGWSGTSFMNCTDFNIYGDPATSLPTFTITFTINPNHTVAGETITAVEVTVKDPDGNTDITYDGTEITLAIKNNPGSGTLSGDLTRTVSLGVATFDDLSIDKAGVGYTLEATATGFASTTSEVFNITHSTATKLGYTVQPSNTNYGATITPAVKVAVQDEYGNTVTNDISTLITITITTNPSEGTLSGTKTNKKVISGVATFDDLSIDKTGTGYTLLAISSPEEYTSVTSNTFNITVPGSGGGGGGGGTCLIATAVYTDSHGLITDSHGSFTRSLSHFPIYPVRSRSSKTTVSSNGAFPLSPGHPSPSCVTSATSTS